MDLPDVPARPAHLELSVEGDVLYGRVRGEYDVACEMHMCAAREALQERYGYRLILCDLNGLSGMAPEARRMLVAWSRRQTRPGVVALSGASFTMRTLTALVLRAVRALAHRGPDFAFFATNEEALAWLAGERERLLKEVGSPG